MCPQWKEWDPKDALRNATEAMSLAEKWLGVPQLIRPEDMIDPNIDEQSMMTYLAQFPIAKLKAGAPIRSPSDKTENHAQASVKSKCTLLVTSASSCRYIPPGSRRLGFWKFYCS